jgi:hypothetical protein
MAGRGEDDAPTYVGSGPERDDNTIASSRQGGDETIISSPHGQQPTAPQPVQSLVPQSAPPPKKPRRTLWIVLGIVAVLLCLAVVAGTGFYFLSAREGGGILAGLQKTPSPVVAVTPGMGAGTVEIPPTPTMQTPVVASPVGTPTTVPGDGGTEVTKTPKATSTAETIGAPSIGAITFAEGATDDARPIGASDDFSSDVAEVHAIFDYSGFEDGASWERHWYKNGKKVGGGTGVWADGVSGTYHMSLNSGGQPLGVGDWMLEIYLDGELVGSGEFIIGAGAGGAKATPGAEASPSAAPDEEPTEVVAAGGVYDLSFSRWDGGKHNLYAADTNGDNEVFVLERASGPSWSPDGRYIYAYGSEGVDRQVREGQEYTWPEAGISNGVIRLDFSTMGSGIPDAFQDNSWKEGKGRYAALAPNGTMLAFDAQRGGSDWRIYFLGTGENLRFNIEIPGEQAAWSPDSNRLVYRSGRENRQGIWISNRDDSGASNITNDGSDAFPRWSPDGRRIAFHRESGGNVDVYTMNVDGSNIRRLTEATGPDTLPAWTPDGRIVFRSARSGSWGIYIMNADSSDQRLIISNADPGPDWAFGRMDVH